MLAPKTKFSLVLLLSLVITFVILSLGSAQRESLTYDEITHVEEGKRAILSREFKVDVVNPPLVRELAVLPLLLGADKLISSPVGADKLLPARSVIIFLGVLLLISVYFVAKQYFGENAALLAGFLLAFEPDILAHSHYVTLDLGFTFFFFMAFAVLLKLLEKPSLKKLFLTGITFGLASGAKISAVLFYGLSGLGAVFIGYGGNSAKFIFRNLRPILLIIFLSLLVVWATYFFTWDTVIIKANYANRLSDRVITYAEVTHNPWLLAAIDFLKNQPLPLGTYLATVKNSLIYSSQQGQEVFFGGRYYSRHLWYFPIVNLLLKTPLPLLILFFWSLLRWQTGQRKIRMAYFMVPILSILLVSVISSTSPLIRYFLPLYPFMTIVAASGVLPLKRGREKIILAGLVIWYVLGTTGAFPHFIAYTNEFAGRKPGAYLFFSDSNLDWGQSLPDLKNYVQEKKPAALALSYFGRDDASAYGFPSEVSYGSYKFNEICAFHPVKLSGGRGNPITAISISNWYACGYFRGAQFAKNKIIDVVGDSFLIFH